MQIARDAAHKFLRIGLRASVHGDVIIFVIAQQDVDVYETNHSKQRQEAV